MTCSRPRHLSALVLALLTLLVPLAAPLAARAQAAGKVCRVGWLSPASAANGVPYLDALRAGLRELGYVEGRNVTMEARWADGQISRLAGLAAELVRLRVDVICTAGSQACGAAKQATTTIPIVFANVAFPDQTGLVASYPRPGGNITGVAFIGLEYGKRFELLSEANPKMARVALLYNPNNLGSVLARRETERWAQDLRLASSPTSSTGPGTSSGCSPPLGETSRTR